MTRTVTQDGKVIHQDTFVSHYPMYPRLVDVGRGTTTTTVKRHDDDQAAHATTTTKPPTTTTTAAH